MNKELKSHFQKAGVSIGEGKYHEEVIYGIALAYTAMYNEISAYLKKHHLTPEGMNTLMLIKHQGKDKVLNRIRELRGGSLYDSGFGQRMSGQGLFAKHIRDMFDLSVKRAGLSECRIRLSAASFRNPFQKQMTLF